MLYISQIYRRGIKIVAEQLGPTQGSVSGCRSSGRAKTLSRCREEKWGGCALCLIWLGFFLSGFLVDRLYVGPGRRKPLSHFTFPNCHNLSLELFPHLKKTFFLLSSLWGVYSAIGICTQWRKGFEAVCDGEKKEEGPGRQRVRGCESVLKAPGFCL